MPRPEQRRGVRASTLDALIGGDVGTPTSPPVGNGTNPQVGKPTTQKFSVHGIETTVIWRLKQVALDQHRKLGDVVADALNEYLERHGG
jgi:hypothetical protein